MNSFLLYHQSAADKTGPLLGEALGIKYGTDLHYDVTMLIRYGTTKPIKHRAAVTLNSVEAISLASNKRGALEILLRQGISAPAPTAVPLSLPAVGRKNRHESGSGFWLCLQQSDVTYAINHGANYFIPYIPTQNEYRVHVLRGEVLLMQRKVKRKPRGMWQWMRNNKTGWGLDTCEPISKVGVLGVRAVCAMGLDFGAADIIQSDRGYFYVLEVNTAPALRAERLQAWSDSFRRIMENV